MITYTDVPGAGTLQLRVRLEKKIVGGIYKNPVFGTFYYKPAGGLCGADFRTIEEVKQSLEE